MPHGSPSFSHGTRFPRRLQLDAWLTAGVILVALALFITEVVTVDLAAIIIMALLLVLGLVSPEEGISGFANPATITVLAMFILSAGVERTGLVNLLAQRVARVAGGRGLVPQLLAILIIVAPVSAFINNTAAVAILLPLVVGLARETGRAPSKLLIPLSFGSMLGGVVTLIGTSTNLLASSISSRLGHGAFTMFEFSAPGAIVALVGVLYLVLVGRFLLPDRGVSASASYNVQEYLAEVTVPPGAPVAGRSLASLDLTGRYGVEVVLYTRGEATDEPTASTTLREGDVLVLLGVREKIIDLANLEGLAFKGERDGLTPREREKILLYESLVTPQSRLVGRTLAGARFRSRYGGTVVAVRKGARVLSTFVPISRAHLDVGDALLVAGTEEDRERVRASDDLLLIEELGGRKYRREKMPIALAIFAGVVGLAATGYFDILVTSIAGAALMALSGVLTMDEFHDSIRWDVLFLLAGVIPLGIAMTQSGLADVLADIISGYGALLPPIGALMLVYGVTTVLTEVLSNNAAVVLLAPVAAATAVALDLNPKTFILAVAFAASTSFLTPIGYQTNLLVYGPGGYRFSDYARVGLPLNLLLLLVTPYLLARFFPL